VTWKKSQGDVEREEKESERATTHHVGLRVARDERGAEHLRELLHVRLEASDGVDDADEG